MGSEPSILTRGGVEPDGKTSLDGTDAAIQLDRAGASWSAALGTPATVTYAFRATGSPTANGSGDFSEFNAQQITIATEMLAAWSDVADITFARVGSGTSTSAYSDNAAILLGNYNTGAEDASGYTYFPGSTSSSSVSGDVWINGTLSYNTAPAIGNYGATTLVHELGHAIGLSHPSDYDASDSTSPTYANSASYYEDSEQYSVMSYFDESNTGGNFGTAYPATPMLDDISAAQRLYGANETTRTGDTVYGFHSTAGRPWFDATLGPLVFAVWDAGGNDTFDFSGYSQNQKIDLRAGQFSNVGGLTGNVAIAYGVTIENAIGGSGNDVIIGNDAANLLQGGAGNDYIYGVAGNDTIQGGAGDDTIDGGTGSDMIDGGAGTDTLVLTGNVTDYTALQNSDASWSLAQIYGGTDHITNIETVSIAGTSMTWAAFTAAAFDGLRYIASYPDLIAALGANAAAGRQHFFAQGKAEGRALTFDPLEYAASNLDLYRAFGTNYTALESHYITNGYAEHRAVASFDPLEYTASNADLVAIFGTDAHAATLHYLSYGLSEGRPTATFSATRYLLANPSLYSALGTDQHALLVHYLTYGASEGRVTTSDFSALDYAASNPDLMKAFGIDQAALTTHWLQTGWKEGRSFDSFDPYAYAVANPDLYKAFGLNADALATHYIDYGYAEHRNTGTFDPALYAASNPDLVRAFGADLAAATQHYLSSGIAEHRPTTGFDTLEYAASNPTLIGSVGLDAHALAYHYLVIGFPTGLATASFDAVAYMMNYGAAQGSGTQGAISQYVHGGYLQHTDPNGLFGSEQTNHALAVGTTYGSFETTGDRDWYSFTLTDTETVAIALAGNSNPSLDTYLALYNGNGNRIGANDDYNNSQSSFLSQSLGAGTYYVAAATYRDAYSGNYSLSLTETATSASAQSAADLSALTAANGASTMSSVAFFTPPSPTSQDYQLA